MLQLKQYLSIFFHAQKFEILYFHKHTYIESLKDSHWLNIYILKMILLIFIKHLALKFFLLTYWLMNFKSYKNSIDDKVKSQQLSLTILNIGIFLYNLILEIMEVLIVWKNQYRNMNNLKEAFLTYICHRFEN